MRDEKSYVNILDVIVVVVPWMFELSTIENTLNFFEMPLELREAR